MMCRRLRLRRVGWRYRKPISFVHFEFPNGAWRAGSHHPPYTDGLGWAATTGRGCECDQIYSFTLVHNKDVRREDDDATTSSCLSGDHLSAFILFAHTNNNSFRRSFLSTSSLHHVGSRSLWNCFRMTTRYVIPTCAITNTRTGFCIAPITILLNV